MSAPISSDDSSNYLLVPMNVQALVVNDQVLAETAFQCSQMNYGNLASYLSPAPPPLDTTGAKPAKGIHLHWDLPAACKHAPASATGGHSATGKEFPVVPNRWMILRFWPGGGAQDRKLKAWILQSDLLADAVGNNGSYTVSGTAVYSAAADTVTIPVSPQPINPQGGGYIIAATANYAIQSANLTDSAIILQGYGDVTADFPNATPFTVAGSGGSPYIAPDSTGQPSCVGGNSLLSNWAGEPEGPPAQFLKAIGPGNLSFAAFRPNVDNVFSFVDDGSDNQGKPLLANPGETVELSYLVVGWFSHSSGDPLHAATDAATWAQLTSGLKWLTSIAPYEIHSVNPASTPPVFVVRGYGDVSAQFTNGSAATVTSVTTNANDGPYTVSGTAAYDRTTDTVTVPVQQAIPSRSGGGYIVPAAAPATWPNRTLIHGLLMDVAWQDSVLPPRPNSTATSVSTNVQVALGNTSIDALAAMVASQSQEFLTPYPITVVAANALTIAPSKDLASTFPPGSLFTVKNGVNAVGSYHVSSTVYESPNFTIYTQESVTAAQVGYTVVASNLDAELLEAFQYNLLPTVDEPDGAANLDTQLRRPWFSHAPGGTLWSLDATPRQHTAAAAAAPEASLAQLQWLAELNYYQGGLDRETRVLESMQDDLYTLWWKVQRIAAGYQPSNIPARPWSRISPEITAALPTEAAAVTAQLAAVAAWQLQIDTLAGAPPSYTTTGGEIITISTYQHTVLGSALTLKGSQMPRFYRPNDPVLLVSGLNPSLDLSDPTLIGQEYLSCRFADQVVSGITVTGTAITATEVKSLVALPDNANLPAAVTALAQALSLESVFLDADNAAFLQTVAPSIEASAIASAISVGQSFTGTAPDQSAATPWQQSWVPLFIDWQVNWYPTVEAATTSYGWGPWSFDRDDWKFDGKDYNWQGGDVTAAASTNQANYAIQAVNATEKVFTVQGQGNLTALFPGGALFNVTGSTANDGSYTVASTAFTDPGFEITVNQVIPSAVADGDVALALKLGAGTDGVPYVGRTFLTPKATFDFRSRLQQYLAAHQQTGDAKHLLEVEHLIDMIGGARYAISTVTDLAPYTISVPSEVDLVHLFPVDSTCYIVGSAENDGVYTVVGATYDGATLALVTQEALSTVSPDYGKLVPQPVQWDFLSQSLTGFTDQLIMRKLEPNAPPSGTTGNHGQYNIATLVNGQNRGVPDVGAGDDVSGDTPPPYFFPVRGGFFVLRKLYIVDRFGQSIDLLFANGNGVAQQQPDDAWKTFPPIRSRWLAPKPDETTGWSSPGRLLKLPPRLVAESRLDVRFVSAPDAPSATNPADVDLEVSPDASPVCGWLLPNHLDQGVTVYDAGGEMLGEILFRQVPPAGSTIDWQPAPNSALPIATPSAIPNPHLCSVVNGLFNLPDQGGTDIRGTAFQNLLQAIDETLWTIQPKGANSSQTMATLIGRPLAVVRARLRLTLSGQPPCDQTTEYAAPTSYSIGAVDTAAGTFSVTAMPVDLSSWFPIGGAFAVSGSSGNDGEYHIVATTYSTTAQTFTVTVQEPIPSSASGGNLVASAPTGGIEAVPFSVRLGRTDLFDDGVLGYFSEGNYARFNNVHNPADYVSVGYLMPVGMNGNYLSLAPYTETAQGAPPTSPPVPAPTPGSTFVTLLADPHGSMHSTTGIFPVKDTALPPRYYEATLAKMNVTFRTGPLLVDPKQIRLPRPSERHGKWSWIQKDSTASGSWEEDPLNPETTQARLSDTPLTLVQGWLKLSRTDP